MNPIMIQKIIASLVIVLLSLATLYEARFIGLCQDGECFQMNRRAPIGRGDDFNDMYNFMRFVGQNKVIGRTFNSPFLGKRNGMEPNEKE